MEDLDTGGRRAPPEHRRMQLILATISVVARNGLSQATLSNIASEAGVSHGLANFHFAAKGQLLVDTLSHLAIERGRNLLLAVKREPSTPAGRFHSLILAETLMICQSPEWISAWYALWCDPQSRGDFLARHKDVIPTHVEIIEDCCRDLIENGGYQVDLQLSARLLRMTIEGVWLDSISHAGALSGSEAYRTVLGCAAMLFPRHFKLDSPGSELIGYH